MKKAIVTGANGFVGRTLCEHLLQKGISVVALVRDNHTDLKDLDGLKFVCCDMLDYKDLPEILNDRNADVLYHMAWMGSAGNLRGDYKVQLDNVKSSCALVEACSKMNCNRIVFPASIMEYELEKVFQTEKEVGINSLYSCAKLSADYMIRVLAGAHNIDYIRTVISNIYGPGEYSPRLINSTIRKILKKEYCKFSSGEQLYDFIYIDDAVEALIRLAENGVCNKTYYVGSGKPRPLKEFILELGSIVDSEVQLGIGELPFDGVSLNYDEFDMNAVENDTGFISRTSFTTGIKNTLEWIRNKESGIY